MFYVFVFLISYAVHMLDQVVIYCCKFGTVHTVNFTLQRQDAEEWKFSRACC